MSQIRTSLVLTLTLMLLVRAQADCESGWLPYGDEKCFKILGELVTRDAALALCENATGGESGMPPLLEIKSQPEQAFLSQALFEEYGILDSVWLGAARFNGSAFNWGDGSPVEYANWGEGFPTTDSSNGCAQLTSSFGMTNGVRADAGEWRDVPCAKRNVPVCQKESTLSVAQLQKVVFNLVNNPVPKGFIYVQLPFHDKPDVLWPGVMWRNVTEEYAGLFFRAAGGTAAPFGSVQGESCNTLGNAQYNSSEAGYAMEITVPKQGWSDYARLGYGYYEPLQQGLRFQNSGEETRPRNAAVLIWERV